jgi:hypothetical protein
LRHAQALLAHLELTQGNDLPIHSIPLVDLIVMVLV